jgi:AbrB family looped-hinge helix DNA binding protein
VITKSKLTSKGQITLPKPVRDRLALRTGDEIEFVEVEGIIQLRKRAVPSPFGRYIGYLTDLAGRDVDSIVEAPDA